MPNQPHPRRDEFIAMGYEGVIEKYGSISKAARAVGVCHQTIVNWAPNPTKPAPRFKGFDKEYKDLPLGAARVLRVFKKLLAETGRSPPIRDVMRAAGFASPNAVVCFLKTLEQKGYVVRPLGRYKSCGIQLTEKAGAVETPQAAIKWLILHARSTGGPAEIRAAQRVQTWMEGVAHVPSLGREAKPAHHG